MLMIQKKHSSYLLATITASLLPVSGAFADIDTPDRPGGHGEVDQVDDPRTWFVSTTGSDFHFGTQLMPYRTIGRAISAANDGDTIRIFAGTYRPASTLELDGKAVSFVGDIDSGGAPATFISGDTDADGEGDIRVFSAKNIDASDWGFSNLEIRDGYLMGSGGGAGMYLSGANPFIDNCHFRQNETEHSMVATVDPVTGMVFWVPLGAPKGPRRPCR